MNNFCYNIQLYMTRVFSLAFLVLYMMRRANQLISIKDTYSDRNRVRMCRTAQAIHSSGKNLRLLRERRRRADVPGQPRHHCQSEREANRLGDLGHDPSDGKGPNARVLANVSWQAVVSGD